MMMNYIELEENTPLTMHFTDHYWVERMIWDKDLEKEKPVRTLVFQVDQVNGKPDIRTFSVLSKRLVDHLAPYLKDSRHRDFEITITRHGSGFSKSFEVEAKPLPPDSLV